MKKAEFVCDVCGRKFFMKDSLKNHACIEEVKEKEIKADDISELSRKELVGMAKEFGVKGADRMSKDELIEAVK